jgi:hypothetical protein
MELEEIQNYDDYIEVIGQDIDRVYEDIKQDIIDEQINKITKTTIELSNFEYELILYCLLVCSHSNMKINKNLNDDVVGMIDKLKKSKMEKNKQK